MSTNPLPTVLSIAGSDCSAGAGIQADLKTIHALHGYALTVPTAITAQNSHGVQNSYPLPSMQVQSQLESLAADYQIEAIKIGILANREIIQVVVDFLKKHPRIPVVLDPVFLSSSGKVLLDENAVDSMINELFPLITLLTPNLPELNTLLQRDNHFSYTSMQAETEEIWQRINQLNWPHCLLKGGHSQEPSATDYLILNKAKLIPPLDDTQPITAYASERIAVQHNHGTGCTLSSAIATQLAKGMILPEAVKSAKDYLFKALKSADLAQPHYRKESADRHGGLNHFVDFIAE
ncbi:hydroxymethylpyrimidine/phosphomethylpyrimidine kinase [Thiomicrorhabdus immobilis]|uniref:hydroxymethylpyrimidine kinase n=1 Tax=Thiomicrorhabdus immobilis TaxID=2791037 RepID=A0ABM7MAM3_9GAMM|nr:bifunctional hydroxymethylpyrimidine kinase/phosphomethylpyrimidine kinase [Thiomicrorhabdus immobilis]BCN92345.1 hydroxymethylpyrimidine/phosphomethylpyrimidine kinase [Thiomicrorhabdus immobilis]